MENKIAVLVLVFCNVVFLFSLWHMSHNFMLRSGPTKTKGVFSLNHEDAYRVSEYLALGAFVVMDLLFIAAFL